MGQRLQPTPGGKQQEADVEHATLRHQSFGGNQRNVWGVSGRRSIKVLAKFPEAAKVLDEHLIAAGTPAAQSGRKMLAILTRYVQLFRTMVRFLLVLFSSIVPFGVEDRITREYSLDDPDAVLDGFPILRNDLLRLMEVVQELNPHLVRGTPFSRSGPGLRPFPPTAAPLRPRVVPVPGAHA